MPLISTVGHHRHLTIMKYATGTLLFGAALYNALETMAVSLANDPYRVSQTFETALQANNASHLYTYPTDFTRGIIPVCLMRQRSLHPLIDLRNFFIRTTTIGVMYHFTQVGNRCLL